MNKVFKASILAASVAFAFGANAAVISSTPVQLSQEGLSVGTQFEDKLSFDVVVSKQHASSAEIVLTFTDKVVDLSALETCTGSIVNTPGAGKGTACAGDVEFDYGTGSFTFDNLVITAPATGAHTMSFKVNLGNPLTPDSAFRVTLGGAAAKKAIITGASTVSYASNLAGTPIETGVGTLTEVSNQYSAVVTEKLDAAIERTNRLNFVGQSVDASTDTLKVKLTDLAKKADAMYALAATGIIKVTLFGDFTKANGVATTWNNGAVVGVIAGDEKSVSFDVPAASIVSATGTSELSFVFDNADGSVLALQPSNFTVTANYTFSNGPTTEKADYLSKADAGLWRLDAAVVNVPYLPLGYGLTPNVEISNAGGTDAEIQIEAFDQFSKEYTVVTLPMKAKAHTVTKISEADLQAALGITKAKTSVTFIINADLNDITLVPYYKEGTSRINVLADQYKSDNAR